MKKTNVDQSTSLSTLSIETLFHVSINRIPALIIAEIAGGYSNMSSRKNISIAIVNAIITLLKRSLLMVIDVVSMVSIARIFPLCINPRFKKYP